MVLHSRQFVVDPGAVGTGVYSTYAAALAAVPGVPWEISIGITTLTENITIPTGIAVNGTGPLTIIKGTVDMYPGSTLRGIFFDNRSTVASPYVLGLRFTGSTDNMYIHDCVFYNWRDGNFTTACVEASGTNSAICRIFGSLFYAANRITTSAPLAKVVAIRLLSDFANAVEVYGSNLKTSAGQNGVSESVCVLNQQVGGAGVAFGYARIAGTDWGAAYAGLPIAGGGVTPKAVLLDSANTTHPGLEGDVSCWNPVGSIPVIRSAYAGVPTSVNAGIMGHTQVFHRLATSSGGNAVCC